MTKPTLLILAAGLGTRYGGLKQIEPVGPHGEILIDYSLHDALRSGFGRIVFVIRRSFETAFRRTIGDRFEGVVETAYAWQELDNLPDAFAPPPDRRKPWGTGHAILVARDVIGEPFAVINADDYYGAGSLRAMGEHLAGGATGPRDYAMVGFTLRNTLSEHGPVARGICTVDEHGCLSAVTERKGIRNTPEGIRAADPDGNPIPLTGGEVASMNLWGFHPSVFDHLEFQFTGFLKGPGRDPDAEFYIPSAVDRILKAGQARVRVLPTSENWFGVTYREDRAVAVRRIRQLIEEGRYPERLWPAS